MKTGMIIAEVDASGNLKVDTSVREKLNLQNGDRVELTIKKITSKKELKSLPNNPLYELT